MHVFLKIVAILILIGSVGSLDINRIGYSQSDGSKGDSDETETNHPYDAAQEQFRP